MLKYLNCFLTEQRLLTLPVSAIRKGNFAK